MSLVNLTLLSGPSISVTGGTSVQFGPDGSIVNRGICVIDTTEADVRTQDKAIFKSVKGTLQQDGTWSKDRRSAKIVCPDLLSDGTQDFPAFEISYVGSPLNNAAKITALKAYAIQLINDPDCSPFWSTGALG